MSHLAAVDAVILAGGLGTRLKGVLPEDLPKTLAPVHDRPFLGYLIDHLYEVGVRRVVLSLGFGADHVTNFLRRQRWPADLRCRPVVEPGPLGTGGALRHVLPELSSNPVLALNGDSFSDTNLETLLDLHRKRNAVITLSLAHVSDTSRYGKVQCRPDDSVATFSEKAGSHGPGMINVGAYMINAEVIAAIPANIAVSWEREVLPRYLDHGLYGFCEATMFIDIGTPESLRQASDFFDPSHRHLSYDH